jgi:hypothetical protein
MDPHRFATTPPPIVPLQERPPQVHDPCDVDTVMWGPRFLVELGQHFIADGTVAIRSGPLPFKLGLAPVTVIEMGQDATVAGFATRQSSGATRNRQALKDRSTSRLRSSWIAAIGFKSTGSPLSPAQQ